MAINNCPGVHGIAWHTLLDWRRKPDPLEYPTDEWWDTCQAEGPDPSQTVAEREMARQVSGCLESRQNLVAADEGGSVRRRTSCRQSGVSRG